MHRHLALLALAAFLLLPLLPAAAREGDDIDRAAASRTVAALLKEDPGSDLRRIWGLSESLAAGGKPAIQALREATDGVAPSQRLAIGRALILLEDYTKGLQVLTGIVEDAASEAALKTAALRVLGLEGELEQAEWLEDRIDTTFDPQVKMAMAKALWNLNFSNKKKGKEVLLAYMRSTDPDLRADGALALGEIGAAAEARPVLLEIRDEPTERGRSAAFLLRVLSLEQAADQGLRAEGTAENPPPLEIPDFAKPGRWPLLDEIYELLERYYLDDDKIDRRKLEDAMATGITQALDPFTNVPLRGGARGAPRGTRPDVRRRRRVRIQRPRQPRSFHDLASHLGRADLPRRSAHGRHRDGDRRHVHGGPRGRRVRPPAEGPARDPRDHQHLPSRLDRASRLHAHARTHHDPHDGLRHPAGPYRLPRDPLLLVRTPRPRSARSSTASTSGV